MAEIEIAIFERNALSRRLEDVATLRQRVRTVSTVRNEHSCGISWEFTSHDARRTFERLSPVKESSSD